ncbi:collagen alpha-1(I) chain-like [Balaenoptera ricei]|uniref:collagen alpha-1(I) chain-like n=1 Tax=Balaenoptera ricei TaxID=2746895 RepID=UPI0028BDB5E6|nr:collagen alpha-1(I) chain-like [Balaenoptera ricei]
MRPRSTHPQTPTAGSGVGTERGAAAARGKARGGRRRRGVPRVAAGARIPGAQPRTHDSASARAARPDTARRGGGGGHGPRTRGSGRRGGGGPDVRRQDAAAAGGGRRTTAERTRPRHTTTAGPGREGAGPSPPTDTPGVPGEGEAGEAGGGRSAPRSPPPPRQPTDTLSAHGRPQHAGASALPARDAGPRPGAGPTATRDNHGHRPTRPPPCPQSRAETSRSRPGAALFSPTHPKPPPPPPPGALAPHPRPGPPSRHRGRAAHTLGGPRAGPRAPGSRSEAGRHVPARSRSLARADGGGGARPRPGPPFPARPPGAGRCGHGGRSTTAGRGPDDPRSGERAGAGRGAARRGGQTAAGPPPRPTHNDVGRRAAVAADHGAEPRQARGAKHTGTRPRGQQTRRTRRVDGRGERADEARLARPPTRRRGDDVTEAVAGGGGRAPPRGGPGAQGPGLRARTRVGRRGTTRVSPPEASSAGAVPRHPGRRLASSAPPGARPPSRGSRPPPPNTHEPRPARKNTLPRAHRPPRRAPHTPPPRPTSPPQEPSAFIQVRPPGLAPQGNAPERGDPHRAHTPPPAATRGAPPTAKQGTLTRQQGRAAQRRDGPPPTDAGEDRSRGTRQGGEARVSAASEDHGPARPVRPRRARQHHIDQSIQQARGQKVPKERGTATVADDPARRTPDTWHGACGVVVVSATTGDRRRHRRAGSAGRSTRAGAQAQAGGLKRQGRFGCRRQSKPRALHASGVQSPQRQTPGKTVSAPIWWQKGPFRAKKITDARQRGPSTNRRGGPRDLGPATCPQPFPSTPVPEPSGHLVDPRSVVAKWGRGGRGGKTWERQRAGRGSPSPVRPRGQVPVPPSLSPGEDLVREKEISHSAASGERAPRGTAPGPGRPIRATQYGSGRSPPPGRDSRWRRGRGQGEEKVASADRDPRGHAEGRCALPSPARPPARAGPGPSTPPDPGGLGNIFPGRRLPGDRSPRGTAPVLAVPGLSGSPLAAQAAPVAHLWSPTRKNIGQNESDHRGPTRAHHRARLRPPPA